MAEDKKDFGRKFDRYLRLSTHVLNRATSCKMMAMCSPVQYERERGVQDGVGTIAVKCRIDREVGRCCR